MISNIGLRIEWCRSRARWMRWHEEVQLLYEEMRRVLAFLKWYASWWVELCEKSNHIDSIHTEGLYAYGHRQALIRHAIQDTFENQWKDVDKYIKNGQGMLVVTQDADDDSDNEMA
jgi:hypothetical protein